MLNSIFVSKRYWHFLLSSFLLVILIVVTAVSADVNTQKSPRSAPTKSHTSGPYCGLYCLYTVLKLTGQEVDFKELVKTEYIGSRKGSSLQELKKAAENNGLYATPVNKLTSRGLRQCPHSNKSNRVSLRRAQCP